MPDTKEPPPVDISYLASIAAGIDIFSERAVRQATEELNYHRIQRELFKPVVTAEPEPPDESAYRSQVWTHHDATGRHLDFILTPCPNTKDAFTIIVYVPSANRYRVFRGAREETTCD